MSDAGKPKVDSFCTSVSLSIAIPFSPRYHPHSALILYLPHSRKLYADNQCQKKTSENQISRAQTRFTAFAPPSGVILAEPFCNLLRGLVDCTTEIEIHVRTIPISSYLIPFIILGVIFLLAHVLIQLLWWNELRFDHGLPLMSKKLVKQVTIYILVIVL